MRPCKSLIKWARLAKFTAVTFIGVSQACNHGFPISHNLYCVIREKEDLNHWVESFRFWDEYDYEYEIFSILSNACARTSVILAGKRDSSRHSTTSFSRNKFNHFATVKGLNFSNKKITSLIFQVKNYTVKLSGLNISREYAKKLQVKNCTRTLPRPQI